LRVALVVSETAMELMFDHVQLILVALEQTAERRDPVRVGALEGHLGDPTGLERQLAWSPGPGWAIGENRCSQIVPTST
jgi:hypothetical protein